MEVKSALAGRTYGLAGRGEGRVTFDLRDEYCPWNAGRWTLEVAGGRGNLGPGGADADIALDANDLGAMFLGGISASSLALAGRVVELRPGGLAAADALFRTATLPWCPQEFWESALVANGLVVSGRGADVAEGEPVLDEGGATLAGRRVDRHRVSTHRAARLLGLRSIDLGSHRATTIALTESTAGADAAYRYSRDG